MTFNLKLYKQKYSKYVYIHIIQFTPMQININDKHNMYSFICTLNVKKKHNIAVSTYKIMGMVYAISSLIYKLV